MNASMRTMGIAITSVVVMIIATIGFSATQSQGEEKLRTFSSELALQMFLSKDRSHADAREFYGTPTLPGANQRLADSGPYSTTNVQVYGVDEADSVKTDGEFIYAASSNNVTIVKAFPPESLQSISVVDTSNLAFGSENRSLCLQGLFINDDKLVLIVSAYTPYRYNPEHLNEDVRGSSAEPLADHEPPETMVATFDVSDATNPEFIRSVAVSGSYLGSRMIDDSVYLVAQACIWTEHDDIALPRVWEDGESAEIPATDIHYDPDTSQDYYFMNMLAVDLESGDHEVLSVVAGWASIIYMSQNALYFTVQKYSGDIESIDGVESPEDASSAFTTIYKIEIEGLSMSIVGGGDVKGWLLNQFSMDEYEGDLRVATTTEWSNMENAVYVLDEDMRTVGRLESLAPTERIYSSRFIGDTLFLVTFRQVDPLFVIDLSDPTEPSVVGELEIPGFSSYLHPVDENHVLGIGMDGPELKVSLFNVTDPSHPQEQSTCRPGVGWHSEALYDHKAVLYDSERELLVIPAYCYSAYFDYQSGALVFRVSVSEGVSLRGVVEHDWNWTTSWMQHVERLLYIGDYLYTISQTIIQVNQLDSLSFVDRLVYNDLQDYYWDLYGL